MDIFSAFATDPKLENEGRWVRIGGTDEKPSELLIARAGNKKYNRVISQMFEANKPIIEGKDVEAGEAKAQEIQQHALASCNLLGWKNVEYKGKSEYSYETARAMLAHRDFRELVQKEADKFQAYKLEQDAVDAKN